MLETLTGIDWFGIGLWAVVIVLMVVGVAGTVIPTLPGIPMIFAGAWLAAWYGHYEHIGTVTLIVLGILTVIGFGIDWVAQTAGAKKAGASKYGIVGALVGTVAGLFLGLFGILFMPLVGAFLGEYVGHRDLLRAGNVGLATWLGMLAGTAIKLAISFTMIGIMLFALWF